MGRVLGEPVSQPATTETRWYQPYLCVITPPSHIFFEWCPCFQSGHGEVGVELDGDRASWAQSAEAIRDIGDALPTPLKFKCVQRRGYGGLVQVDSQMGIFLYQFVSYNGSVILDTGNVTHFWNP